MKVFITILSLISICSVFAPPVISNSSNLQAVGSSNPSVFVSISDIGTGGANQTWDYSSASTTNVPNLSVVDLASTPFAGSFPTSNWTFEIGTYYSYFQSSTSELNNLAFNITSVGGNGDYSMNPRKILEFPFNYNDAFTDVYSENGSSKNLSVSYEGYGTLMMPNGFTYSNVVRVLEDETSNGTYIVRYYLLNPLTIVATYLSQTNVFLWAKVDQSSGLSQIDNKKFGIYPNPAFDQLTIQSTDESEKTFTLAGCDGRIVHKYTLSSLNQTIDISVLPAGWYSLSNGVSTVSFQKID